MHCSEEMVKIAIQHLQESAGDDEENVFLRLYIYIVMRLIGDIMRVVRFLDCPSDGAEGETALMLAARRRLETDMSYFHLVTIH